MANFTYLMMAVVQMFLPEPPVSPMTTIFPLAFVVIVSMVKQVRLRLFQLKHEKIHEHVNKRGNDLKLLRP
jgi:hypothetical protein